MLGWGFSLSLAAGLFAAMASVFSKLAFEEEGMTLQHYTCLLTGEKLCTTVSLPILPTVTGCCYLSSLCSQVVLFLRIGCFLMLLLSNAVMWTLFAKALQGCATTVEAAAANSGSNFICTVCLTAHCLHN